MNRIKDILVSIINYILLVVRQPNSFKITFFKSIRMKFLGFTPNQYILYELDKNDVKNYISEFKRWETRKINKQYTIALDDKLLFYDLFKHHLDIPRNIFRVKNKFLIDDKGRPINKNKLCKIIIDEQKVYLKPIVGGGGKGIFLVEYSLGKWKIDEDVVSFDTVYNEIIKCDGYICSPEIRQVGFSKEVFPKSVNTIRIVTGYQEEKFEVEVLAALHRFGTSKSQPVDNASRGGVFSIIDVNTGELGVVKDYGNNVFTHHPDTKLRITGELVPNWDKIKAKCISVAQNFSYIPYLAWDIVLTDDDISIIEINASTDLQMIQMFGGVKRKDLGIFIRKHGI